MKGLRLIALLALIVLPLGVHAQTPPPSVYAVDSAFVNGNYNQVELLALRMLQTESNLPKDIVARLNLMIGYSLIMLGRESEARGYYAHALDAVPELTLDPVEVSPKFRMVFDEVKASRKTTELLSKQTNAQKPLTINAPTGIRHESVLYNLIVPGSGEWREGERLRGVVVFAVQAAAVGLFLYEFDVTSDARDHYLAQTESDQIRGAYNRYSRNYRATWAAGIGAGLVYVAAQVDLLQWMPRGKAKSPHISFYMPSDSPALCAGVKLNW